MKKRALLLLSIFGILTNTLLAQSDVSGAITSNTTFNLAGSPYTVTASITVANGDTLTIESGVTVKVAANQSIFVNGVLLANGATFTSSAVTPAVGDWSNFQIGDNSNVGYASLTDCQVLNADYLYLHSGSATLTNTILQDFYLYGVYTRGTASLNMTGGSITTTGTYATSYGKGIYATENSVVSASNVSINSFHEGVFLTGNANVNVDGLNISSCAFGFQLGAGDTLAINSSTVSGTTYPIYYSGSGNLTVTGTNNFTGNTFNVAYLYFNNTSSDWHLPKLPIPYYFYSSFIVTSGNDMTIASGNIVKMNSNFTVNGTLTAKGTGSEFVYFTSQNDDNWGGDSNNNGTATSPASQNWGGLIFNNAEASASNLQKCKIRYGGYYNRGGVNLYNSSPTIDSCEFTSNYYGIYMSGTSSPVFSNNSIGSSTITPIAMSFEANPVFTSNSLSFSDNQYDAIGLIGGTLTANATIIKRSFTGIPNITYFMLDKITVPSGISLTINPGVVIKSDTYTKNFLIEGTLKAVGTVSEPIVFTSVKDDNHGNPGDSNKDGTNTTPIIGNFGGIVFAPTSNDTSSVIYCIIKYADAYNEYYYSRYMGGAAIVTVNVSPTISNNEIKDVNYGIKAYEASNPTISNNQMVNVLYTPFAISGSADPVFSGNTYLNAGWNAIGLLGGKVSQNGTIRKLDVAGFTNITYVLLEDMTVNNGTYLDVEPGVVIKMNGVNIYIEGGFKANGTATDKIIFTSIADDNNGNPFDTNGDGSSTSAAAGNWGRIRFQETSDDTYCLINNAEIRYGGNYYYYYNYSNLEMANASPTITNTLIGQSSQFGVRIEGNSAPIFDGVTIQNCSWDPIGMSLTSNPQFSNMSFIANRTKGLAILEGTLSSNATLISRNVAGIDNIAYVLNDQLTIASNATLTFNPNVVIKSTNYGIDVNGALVANGTALQKITFTSIADDSGGGDTNDDGNNSVPASGNWSGLEFKASGIDSLNSLTYVNFRYANKTIRFTDCTALVENCVVEQSNDNAFQIMGSASPTIVNNQIFNIFNAPVYMSMFSNPSFSGNTMANIGISAIQIASENYSQSDTFPFRSFAGYDSITYYLSGTYTITDGTTITIPAGMVFKTGWNYYYYYYHTANIAVNGKLLIQGTVDKPVIFTSFYDDMYGNPVDLGQDGSGTIPSLNTLWFKFNNVSDDASNIDDAIIKYSTTGIELNSASALITNNRFEKLTKGIYMNGVSEPTITGNEFKNMTGSPISISLVAFPIAINNNNITGTTLKVIEVNNETLTQDVSLPKRSFGGIANIPYMFSGYTIGTGAVLTINPGVICKFNTGGISVQKGLLALGSAGSDSAIVFTSMKDDFYGGDSNSDSTATYPSVNSWGGITFENTSIDASCKMDYCTIKYAGSYPAYAGVSTNSSSPTISNCAFITNGTAVSLKAASNPTINYCDFYDNATFGINNVDKSFTIDATNNWWGNNSGPIHVGNPGGTGQKVSDAVTYSPWITNGSNNPILGDVSLNGLVQAYDASLILQHTVSNITLTPNQLAVADVSGNGGADPVTAYDAALILQFNVGLIDFFPAANTKKSTAFPIGSDVELVVGNSQAQPGEDIVIPISINNVSDIFALQAQLTYDRAILEFKGVEQTEFTQSMSFIANQNNSGIYLSLAGITRLSTDGIMANLLFSVVPELKGIVNTPISVSKFLANDKNLTNLALPGDVKVYGSVTGIESLNSADAQYEVFPNPFQNELTVTYKIFQPSLTNIEVYNVFGQLISVLVNESQTEGLYSVKWDGNTLDGTKVTSGFYFIKINTNGTIKTTKIQML
ncbi:MAG: right-handed parallel beta-helix repeat-containing protein [Salinivirgaceae bacterium]